MPELRRAPTLPPFSQAALLLDVDGTLLDIAPTPSSVVVPPGLLTDLVTLRDNLGGALAVITGRPIEQIDALFGPVPHAVAGEHGGAIRYAPAAPVERAALPAVSDVTRAAGAAIAAAHPGTLLEPKARGFVLHYRAAPEHGPSLQAALVDLLGGDSRFAILPALMAWEIRPVGADKGTAVAALMARPPFAGRLPVFIGDDVTDRDAIDAAEAEGGAGLFVPDIFDGPAAVRAWLGLAAVLQNWPLLPKAG